MPLEAWVMKELAHPMAYTWTNRARRGPAKVERAIPPPCREIQ